MIVFRNRRHRRARRADDRRARRPRPRRSGPCPDRHRGRALLGRGPRSRVPCSTGTHLRPRWRERKRSCTWPHASRRRRLRGGVRPRARTTGSASRARRTSSERRHRSARGFGYRRARHGARNASLHAQRHKSRAYVAARPRRADECRQAARPPRPPGRGASLSPFAGNRCAPRSGTDGLSDRPPPICPRTRVTARDMARATPHSARSAINRAQMWLPGPPRPTGRGAFPVPVRPKSRCWFIRASHRSTPTAAPAGSPTGSPFVGRGDAYSHSCRTRTPPPWSPPLSPRTSAGLSTSSTTSRSPHAARQRAGGRCRAAARATAADPRGAGRPRRADGVPPA